MSIRKRGKNSWELTIDLGRDEAGKRQRQFENVKGTKADAQKRLRELLTSLDKGIPLSPGKITIAAWLDRWMQDYVIPTLREKSIERY